MFNYVVRRTLQAIPLLIVISMILYGILSEAPGGALAPYLANPHITAADITRLKHNLGLDAPIPVRYVIWLGHVVTGDFGYSASNSEPVLQAIVERVPATLSLMATSLVLSLLVGLALGIYSAVKPYSIADYFITTFAFFGQSMPVFWLALMLQLGLAVHGIPLPAGYIIKLPSAGIATDTDNFSLPDHLVHLVLPVIVLSFLSLALYSRFTRSSMLEVMRTDYMRTAAAKGLSFPTIVLKHGLKNGLIPLVTIVALSLPGLLGGAIVTETIFAWPGMGRLFYNALLQQDIALLMGYLCLVSAMVVFFNLFADVAYAWLDPRVKYD